MVEWGVISSFSAGRLGTYFCGTSFRRKWSNRGALQKQLTAHYHFKAILILVALRGGRVDKIRNQGNKSRTCSRVP
jgi:hypothetical protein